MLQYILFHYNSHNTRTLTQHNNDIYGNNKNIPYIYVLNNMQDYVQIHKHEWHKT
jgi:hypothetical protein